MKVSDSVTINASGWMNMIRLRKYPEHHRLAAKIAVNYVFQIVTLDNTFSHADLVCHMGGTPQNCTIRISCIPLGFLEKV